MYTTIAIDDIYQKLLQVMKHGYIILNLKKKNNKMWLTKTAKRPVKAKRCQSTKEVLLTNFFITEGTVVQIGIPNERSITDHVYKEYVLNKIKKETKVLNSQHSTYS